MPGFSSTSIHHLGLVAAMCDELGISSLIDSEIKQDLSQRNISIGLVMKALVINSLGFSERRIYLTSRFFGDKPVELLLGRGVRAEFLNDGVIGRAMDRLQEYGTTEMFSKIAANAFRVLGLSTDFVHMDSTTFHVDGAYNSGGPPADGQSGILITKGYSRDHRPDLNQVVLNMIADNSAGIPLFMEALSGNSSDKTTFRATVENHISNLRNVVDFKYLVADSALYTAENIRKTSALSRWISRVPETVSEARNLVETVPEAGMLAVGERAKFAVFASDYGGVAQRWLLVWSKDAFTREVKTLNAGRAEKGAKEAEAFKKLCREEFACPADAQKALDQFTKKLKHIEIQGASFVEVPSYAGKGRPRKGEVPAGVKHRIAGAPCSSIDDYERLRNTKGRFIVATNELDSEKLTDIQLFEAYKNQGKVERGFRFMKDPQFMASTIFVKKPERVEVVLMLMTLALLVYAALEHRLRQGLRQTGQTVPDQKGKPAAKPTMRWVFALFAGIHVLSVQGTGELVCLNLNDVHAKIMDLLGMNYKKYYFR